MTTQQIAKSNTKIVPEETIATEKVDPAPTPSRSAYMIIVPSPYHTDKIGIECNPNQLLKNGRTGAYYFWMKIGDSENPETRLKSYKNRDQAESVLLIKDYTSEGGPGKALELECLQGNAIGGLFEGKKSEWRILYAADIEAADKLRANLEKLLDNIDPKNGAQAFSDISAHITTAVSGTTGGSSAHLKGKKYPRVSMIVTPHLSSNHGYISNEGGKYENSFEVAIVPSLTQHMEIDSYIAENYKDMSPDIAYKGFLVEEGEEDKTTNTIREEMCKTFNCAFPNYTDTAKKVPSPFNRDIMPGIRDDGWFTVLVKTTEDLIDLRTFFREFSGRQ